MWVVIVHGLADGWSMASLPMLGWWGGCKLKCAHLTDPEAVCCYAAYPGISFGVRAPWLLRGVVVAGKAWYLSGHGFVDVAL